MKKIFAILAAVLASATPASAYTVIQVWDCGKNVTVTLNKYSTGGYEISITGALIVNPQHSAAYNFKLIQKGSTFYPGPLGVSLNGRSCRALPGYPKEEKDD